MTIKGWVTSFGVGYETPINSSNPSLKNGDSEKCLVTVELVSKRGPITIYLETTQATVRLLQKKIKAGKKKELTITI